MSNRARHRPARSFSEAPRVIVACELERCVHCGEPLAASEEDLLDQIRQATPDQYHQNRQRLEQAEAPRRLLRRLHRASLGTMQTLAKFVLDLLNLPTRSPAAL